MNRRVLVATALAVLLSACSGGGDEPEETDGTSSAPATTASEVAAVVVPDLIGMSRTEAEAAIEAVGLLPIVATSEGQQDDVISQTPAVGERVDPGHEVTILVRCVPAPCPTVPEGKTIYDPCGCLSR